MAVELLSNNAHTTCSGAYTSGSGVLNVVSTDAPFPQSGTFRVTVSGSDGTVKVILKVTAKNSSTQWEVVAEGTDANATDGDNVDATLTANSLFQYVTENGVGYQIPYGDPTLVSFGWRNQGGATATTRAKSIYLYAPAGSGDQLRGYEIAAPSPPWSVTVRMIPQLHSQNYNQCGLYCSDGTKLLSLTVPSGINRWNTVSSFSATVVNPGFVNWGLTAMFITVLDDGTDLKWFWSVNAYDFIQVYTASRTSWLSSVSYVGLYVDSNNSTWPVGMSLLSWVQGTS